MNVINVREMYGSQIQQSTTASHQSQTSHLDFSDPTVADQLQDLIDAYREQMRSHDFPPDIEAEAVAEIGTIENQLRSLNQKWALSTAASELFGGWLAASREES